MDYLFFMELPWPVKSYSAHQIFTVELPTFCLVSTLWQKGFPIIAVPAPGKNQSAHLVSCLNLLKRQFIRYSMSLHINLMDVQSHFIWATLAELLGHWLAS
jgi:hypothetical protein